MVKGKVAAGHAAHVIRPEALLAETDDLLSKLSKVSKYAFIAGLYHPNVKLRVLRYELMAADPDTRHTILQKTLEEVSNSGENGDRKPCVICLDSVRIAGIALPCHHDNFDFQCIVKWLEMRQACPLCQVPVSGVKSNSNISHDSEVLWTPQQPNVKSTDGSAGLADISSIGPSRPRQPIQQGPPDLEQALRRRRHIYRNQLYSLRVGSNRYSRYREITPQLFSRDEQLIDRARKWIRRELRVFAFGGVDDSRLQLGNRVKDESAPLRARNADFFLEYIIAILKTVDIKGSGGQAEELLREFFGRQYTPLFLHELQTWLRSPFDSLAAWDDNVQYDEHL